MLLIPMLFSIVQPFPFTLTQDVAAELAMPVPFRVLPEIVPPMVPSLMSMFSAVVLATLLPMIRLLLLASGWQPLYLHQFLWAVPTYMPSPKNCVCRPVSRTMLWLTVLLLLKSLRWMASSPIACTYRP